MLTSVAVLLLLGTYLCLEWLRNYQSLPVPMTRRFWLFDAGHLFAVSFSALAAYEGNELLVFGLIAYFVITGTGHVTGTYATKGDHACDRYKLAVINYLGVPLIFLGAVSTSNYRQAFAWTLPLSLSVVVALWLLQRWPQLKKLATEQPAS
jgi:uncharacterized membrane protein YhhN